MKRAEKQNAENLERDFDLEAKTKGPSTCWTVLNNNGVLKIQKTSQGGSHRRRRLAKKRYRMATSDEDIALCGGHPRKDSLPDTRTKAKKQLRQLEGILTYENGIDGQDINKSASLRLQKKSSVRLQNETDRKPLSPRNAFPKHSTSFENGVENIDWRPRFDNTTSERRFKKENAKTKKTAHQLEGILAYQNNTIGKGSIKYTSLSFQGKSNVRLQNQTVRKPLNSGNAFPGHSTSFENDIENKYWRPRIGNAWTEELSKEKAIAKKTAHQVEGILTYKNNSTGKGNTKYTSLRKGNIKYTSLSFRGKSGRGLQNETKRKPSNSGKVFSGHSTSLENDIENIDWRPRFFNASRERFSKKAKAKMTAHQSEGILAYKNDTPGKGNTKDTSLCFHRKSGIRHQNRTDNEPRSSDNSISFEYDIGNMDPKPRFKAPQHCYYAYKGFEVIPLQCEICDVTVNEVEPLFAHFNCSKHKKNINNPKIRKYINFEEYSRRLDLMIKILDMRKNDLYECHLCSLMFRERENYKAHKKSKIHVEKLFKSCYTVVVNNDGKSRNMHLDFKLRL